MRTRTWPVILSLAVVAISTSASSAGPGDRMQVPTPRPDWLSGGVNDGALVGYSVATAGDVNGDGYDDVIVGEVGNTNPQHDEGRALVFHGGPEGLTRAPRWRAEGNRALGYFGGSVDSAGDVNGDGFGDVLVGAWGSDRAYVYLGSASGLHQNPGWTVQGVRGTLFGYSVAGAGDVNGDGFDDVIVGASEQGPGFRGRVYAYFGTPEGPSDSADWIVIGDQRLDYFGHSVGAAGDVNGDGFADVIVGSPFHDGGGGDAGRAFLFRGSSSGLRSRPAWVRDGDSASVQFGGSVGTAGDVNGDGFDDVAVGARFTQSGGRAYAFFGSASGLRDGPNWVAEGIQSREEFGSSVGTAGDLNADGYDDLLVGAPWYSGGQSLEGRTAAYYGSAAGLSTSPTWTAEGNAPALLYCTCFGFSVGTAGDVNGDGRSDAVIGAPYYTIEGQEEGAAFAYYGRP